MSDNTSKLFSKIFSWLGIGLLITFGIGYYLSINEPLMMKVLSIGIFPIIIAEIVISIILGFRIRKMNPVTAKILYILYCSITGITFSSIFVLYKISSIISIFAICAIIFGLLALYGMFTKKDISKIGTILFISLIGLIVGELLNFLIFKSYGTELVLSAVGVLIFMGYIIYDIQFAKSLSNYLDYDKAAVYGAFQLYLDFINLFIRLLEILGKRNND